MGQRARKKEALRNLLLSRDAGAFHAWMVDERNPDKVLQRLLYDSDPLVQWRTIEAIGEVTVFYAGNDLEKVRLLLRGLFWLMNDESGGLVWNAPEAIGQVLFRLPTLICEYGRILSSFIHEEPFERGTHWALSRIIPLDPQVFQPIAEDLMKALVDDDPYIRGYAAVSLSGLTPGAVGRGHRIFQDDTPLRIYDIDSGGFIETTVSALAGKAASLVANA